MISPKIKKISLVILSLLIVFGALKLFSGAGKMVLPKLLTGGIKISKAQAQCWVVSPIIYSYGDAADEGGGGAGSGEGSGEGAGDGSGDGW